MSRTALALVSGGLDSLLAVVAAERRGYDVRLLHVETGTTRPQVRWRLESFARGELDGRVRRLEVLHDVRPYMMNIVEPWMGERMASTSLCTRCRPHLLRLARCRAENRDVLVCGDVIGQGGGWQRRDTLAAIDAEAGVSGRVWRPLSERQLGRPVAVQEEPAEILALHGDSRRGQVGLARAWGLNDVPPTKGRCCWLADRRVRARLIDDLAHERVSIDEGVDWLGFGRHGRHGGVRVVAARTEVEARRLDAMKGGVRMSRVGSVGVGRLFTTLDGSLVGGPQRPPDEIGRTAAASLFLSLLGESPERRWTVCFGADGLSDVEAQALDAETARCCRQ